MQKVLQRAQRAARVAERAKAKEKKLVERGERQRRGERRLIQIRNQNAAIRQARLDRKEDWELGPLAPRRDAGLRPDTYGTIAPFLVHPAPRESLHMPKWQHIMEGDRVVLLRGHDKGRIGTVSSYDKDSAYVSIKGVNVVDVSAPAWMAGGDADGPNTLVPHARAVPVEDVRLVYPLPDPKTGIMRDVMIEELIKVEASEEGLDDAAKKRGYRAIPGTNTIIPWPAESDEPSQDAYEIDTVRLDVDEETYRPSLIFMPLPGSVIDELRNKYSRFRTRHDHEFVAKITALEEKAEQRKALIKGMRTPLAQLAEVRAQKKRAEQRELTDQELARIGEVMAAHQLEPSGVVRESPGAAT